MKTKFGKLFTDEELSDIRAQFHYVDHDAKGNKRLFFDNAGGALRLIKAEDAFRNIDEIPDASEHSNVLALELAAIENVGRENIRVMFNANKGAIATGYTASMLMMNALQVISSNAKGTNCVTTILEHPSSFDAMSMYAEKYKRELRVAAANKKTGCIDTDVILSLVDKNTAILSCMSASNISGHVMDIKTIAQKARKINPDIYIISDAVQHAPHGALNPENDGIDVMNFAPYKFFGIRGFGLMYLSDRVANLPHHKLLGTPINNWETGSPCTAHFAAVSEIVNYVCALGKRLHGNETDRRKLYEAGMDRIADQERALLEIMLEGTDTVKGLRHMKGITVKMDDPDLNVRDFIIGVEFDNMPCEKAVIELEKRNIVVFERSLNSIYSKRMVECFDSKGMVRISPLHVNSIQDIEYFLKMTQEVADL